MTQRNARVYEVSGPYIHVYTPFGVPAMLSRDWYVRGHGGILEVHQWGAIRKGKERWDNNFTVTIHPADTHRSKTLAGIMAITKRLLRERSKV